MTQEKSISKKLFIVDESPADYTQLRSELAEEQVEITHFSSGRDALRSNPEDAPAMWIINVRLRDMSGTTLHDMLRARGSRAPIAVVGDEYNVEDEIAARVAGANFYLAKPLCSELLGITAAHS